MNSRSTRNLLFLSLGALAITGAAALAHHINTPLSYVFGPNVLSSVNLHLRGAQTGVPPYVVSDDEFDHDATVVIQPGDQFTVQDSDGHVETVTLDSIYFADPQNATIDEVIDAVNDQITIGVAFEDNAHVVMRGVKPGTTSRLRLENTVGTPLDTIHLPQAQDLYGADNVILTLSIPEEEDPVPDAFANLPYRVFASVTSGETDLGNGITVPLMTDIYTRKFFEAARQGQLPGFLGNLDGNEDGSAQVMTSVLTNTFGANMPSELYFAFVVYDATGTTPVYASNRFTLTIVH